MLEHERASPRRWILTGGKVVTPTTVIDGGSVVMEGNHIAAITATPYAPRSAAHEVVTDVGGRFVLPGLVCLHNDAIEKAINPRPFANLPVSLALVTLDRSLAAAGVTTQFHALMFDDMPGKERTIPRANAIHDALMTFNASGDNLIDHHVLYRCDVRAQASVDAILARIPAASVRLVSLNDHVPGRGQLRDLARTAERLAPDLHPEMTAAQWLAEREAFAHASETQVERTYETFAHRVRDEHLILMSHDDDTAEKVDQMQRLGCRVAEFPVTWEAARRARALGMWVSMGAPNLVRGGSLSGNIRALDLAREGLIDIVIADYHAPAMLPAAWLLARDREMSLSDAVAAISAMPANAVGLPDRGALAPGRRADVVVVAEKNGEPIPTHVFVAGELRYRADRPIRSAETAHTATAHADHDQRITTY